MTLLFNSPWRPLFSVSCLPLVLACGANEPADGSSDPLDGSTTSMSGPSTTGEPATESGVDPNGDSTTSTSSDPDSDPSTSSSGGVAESSTTATSSDSGGPSLGEPVTVTWTDVVITDGCFLFYDPSVLGTEAQWTEEDGVVTLRFADLAPVLTGAWANGELRLESVSDEDYNGDTWRVTQEIFGVSPPAAQLAGTWHYTECDFTNAPDSCPADGGCTGAATITVSLP